MKLLRSGKVKFVYADGDDDVMIEFRDDITAGNGEKHDVLKGKGALLNAINEIFFEKLSRYSIPNHYVRKLSENSFKAKKVEIVPLEVVVRNYAAGSFCRRYGIKKGVKIGPLVEFFVKNDELGDPLVCRNVAIRLGIANGEILNEAENIALEVNDVVSKFLKDCGLILADFKIEVGLHANKLLVADEITPDTCRFWDANSFESLDKDVYRQSAGDPLVAYREVLRRLTN